jgi:AraC-like DNA-binding protein
MHHHADLRIVLITGGSLTEHSFEGTRAFRAGDFVFRPSHFAHWDRSSETGAHYVRLPVSLRAARRWIAQHGWCAGHGRATLDRSLDGDDLLNEATPNVYTPLASTCAMHRAAGWLANEDACRAGQAAQRLGLAPYVFTRRFAAALGMSPNAYRRQARLQRTFRMLSEDAASLAQIASTAGFHDQSHLSAEFQREIGCTPARWRKLFAAA